MNRNEEALSKLERHVEQALRNHPHSRDILDALMPVILGRIRVLGTLELKGADFGKIDRARLKDGVPVIRQTALMPDGATIREVALAIFPDMKKGLPAIAGDLETLEEGIRKGVVDPTGIFHSFPETFRESVDGLAERISVKPSAVDFLLRTVARIFLEKRAGELAELLKGMDWDKGYCPVCGALPAVSMVQEKGGQRWLHCTQCGHEWRFSRVICPCCGHEGQKGMTYYFVEGRDRESAFICEKCNKYLITFNKIGNLEDGDFEISAMSLVHLDMIMQEKGFMPMTDCPWNAFAT
jgi:FdhE protein